MADVLRFPGAGSPAPGPRVVPVDLDGIGDRYTSLLEARHRRDTAAMPAVADVLEANLLAAACADDVPHLVAEIARVDVLRQELAAELARLAGLPCARRHQIGGA